MLADRVYLSAHSADVILSEIRSTRLKAEALQAINDFLDEIILLVIQGARSFSPAKLKDTFLKLLPTPLGKEAILEAEVELRNHRDRGIPSTPTPYDDATVSNDFPVELAYELLRLKCEECTTLNEINGDFEAESKLMQQLSSLKLKPTVVPAAVFYMTAIIEHICKHILSSVGRVVARDSSRTVASSHDLYVALCEDETIYALFSSMKIYEAVNAQSLVRPRRSRSISHGNELTSSGSVSPIPLLTEGRQRADTVSVGGRPSGDKPRSIRMFRGSGPESQNGHENVASQLPHKRTQSGNSSARSADRHEGLYEDEGSPVSQSFDDHLKSGETVKLSLTPDRLQSMESFKQRGAQRPSNSANGPQARGQPTTPNVPTPTMASPPRSTNMNGGRKRVVESIEERDEESPTLMNGRSLSSTLPSPRFAAGNHGGEAAPRAFPKSLGIDPDMPMIKNKATRKITKNRESLDLDDIMNGFDEDEPEAPPKPSLAPKDATAERTSQRDLMDFLASGPPEETPMLSRSASSGSPQEYRKSGGRFRSMVSRLRNRPSSERLPGSPMEEYQPQLKPKTSAPNGLQNYPRPPRYNTGSGSTPPIAYQSPPSSAPPIDSHGMARGRVSSTGRKAVPEYGSGSDSVDDDVEVLSEPSPPVNSAPQLRTVRSTGFQKPSSPLVKQPAIFPPAPAPPKPSANLLPEARPRIVVPPTPDSPSAPSVPRKAVPGTSPVSPARTPVAKSSANGVPDRTVPTPPQIPVPKDVAKELRGLLARAETVSECRLLVDIFLATVGSQPPPPGVSIFPAETKDAVANRYNHDVNESAFVEFLLGSA